MFLFRQSIALLVCLLLSMSAYSNTQDSIKAFISADFEQQKAMMLNWPYSASDKQEMLRLIESGTLYSDDQYNLYVLKDDSDLLNFADKTSLGDNWPDSLNEVSLNNVLRQIIDMDEAKHKLLTGTAEEKSQSLDALMNNPKYLERDFLQQLISDSKFADYLPKLTLILARKDITQGSEEQQIEAAKNLSDSHEPEVMALLEKAQNQANTSDAAKQAFSSALSTVKGNIKTDQWLSHIFSGLSMASILLLAALGLAITYGLLGVINMAHGELVMIGAYTTYLTQQFVLEYLPSFAQWYLLPALLLAFLVSALVGMIIERLVVKPLYGRELETLLATFGVSLILIQLTRLIFGAQNVAVASSDWLSGGIEISPSLILPYNRIGLIVLSISVLLIVQWLISRTRFGLFVRAVTQNRPMAKAVGINSERVDMLAFGLGSGIAGIAGCALSQIGNVGPELGQSLIVDTFLVVVIGGVGQLVGAALAALGLGVGSTLLEVGMGAVLAKILLLVAIIIFIQRRPKGLFALKGRFVE